MQIRGEPGQSFRDVLRAAIGDDPAAKARVAKALGMTEQGVHMALHREKREGGMADIEESVLRRIAAASGFEVVLVMVKKRRTK